MTFSIVIPVCNVAPYLRECLDSVCAAARKVKDVEVICVDDGSTDGSGAILDEYATRQSNNQAIPNQTILHVLHQPNAGVSAARNAALGIAQGEWLCFVDADDIVRADWLELCRRAIDEFPDADMVRYGRIEFDDGERCQWPEMARQGGSRLLDLRRRISGDVLEGGLWGRVYRRSKVSDVRFPPYTMGEDWAWKVDAVLRMDSLVDIGDVLYGYRQRVGSAILSPENWTKLLSSFKWRMHALHALSGTRKVVDPALERWFLAGLMGWCGKVFFHDHANGKVAWTEWCNGMGEVSGMRGVPWWFKLTAAVLHLTRSRALGFLLVVVPCRVRHFA